MPESAALHRVALASAHFGLPYSVVRSGQRVSEAQAHAILDEAFALGARLLDTAMAYGDSERVLGRHGLKCWTVVSKLPALPEDAPDSLAQLQPSVEGSLKRLGVPALHGLLLYRLAHLLDARGPALLQGLCAVQAQGLVGRIGISIYQPRELAPLMTLHPFGLVQAPASTLPAPAPKRLGRAPVWRRGGSTHPHDQITVAAALARNKGPALWRLAAALDPLARLVGISPTSGP